MKKLLFVGALALCGCVTQDRYVSDKNYFDSELRWQMTEIRQLQKDIIEMRQGYRVIPVRITITNANDGVWRNN